MKMRKWFSVFGSLALAGLLLGCEEPADQVQNEREDVIEAREDLEQAEQQPGALDATSTDEGILTESPAEERREAAEDLQEEQQDLNEAQQDLQQEQAEEAEATTTTPAPAEPVEPATEETEEVTEDVVEQP